MPPVAAAPDAPVDNTAVPECDTLASPEASVTTPEDSDEASVCTTTEPDADPEAELTPLARRTDPPVEVSEAPAGRSDAGTISDVTSAARSLGMWPSHPEGL